MDNRRNHWLFYIFLAYFASIALLIFAIPQVVGVLNALPCDYWWVFLAITPQILFAVLWAGVRTGRFNRWAVGVFWLGTLAFGAWMQWVGYWLCSPIR